jgi:malonate-semialdehyde dehydrogenase (acetylating)/methylmalonate-semialdehyde dehydrogenase
VLNVVHGTHDVVNGILDHPDIAAISFVGGDAAGRYIYGRAAANGKRVQVRGCVLWHAVCLNACKRTRIVLLGMVHTCMRGGALMQGNEHDTGRQ